MSPRLLPGAPFKTSVGLRGAFPGLGVDGD